MNSVIIEEENKEEFEWIPAVFEETVLTPNGVKSPILLKSQKCVIENNTHIPSVSCINSESGKKNIASKEKRKAKKAKDGVKRPLNAFMLYLKEKRAEFVANSTINIISSLEMNKVVGKLWHSLTDEQRAAYYAQAREEKRRHALLHPRKEPTRHTPPMRRCKRTVLPDGFKFEKCRAKYGLDSKNLWCLKCRSKKKCLRLLKALAELNGGVLPLQEPSKDSSEKNDTSSTISKTGFKFKKCRAKYGLDSKHLWCANCRKKRKCLWLLKTLAEENGGVLPKLPPRRKKLSKDSSEKNDTSSTISKTEFEWIPAVFEETVSTPNGVIPPVLLKSQEGEISENNTHIPSASCIGSESGKKYIASKEKRKDKKAKDRVKKPLNAFMLYLKEKRAEFVANSTINKYPSHELTKVAGKLWRSLTDEQRAAYYAQAREEKRRHALLHPRKEPPRRRKRTVLPDGFEFRNCREKYGMDSKNLWCSNCRRKKRCLWILKALAEANGGVLPKLLPQFKKPSKVSSKKKKDSSSTISKPDLRKCRAKYGLDSKHLWCANCRMKRKCLWLLKTLAEENGGVLPKLPLQEPSKDSSEKNDSSSTISKTDINLEEGRQKDNTDLENQESKPRTRRKAIPADKEYNIYVRQLEKMTQSCLVFDGQNEFAKFCLERNAKEDDAKSCLEMNAKEDEAKSCLDMNGKEDYAKPCLEMNAIQGDAKSCFEKNVRQDTELDDNGKEIQIEPYEMKNEIEDFVPHIVKMEIIECEETKIGGIASQAAAVEMIKVENIEEKY